MSTTVEPTPRSVEAPAQGALDRAEGVELLGDVHGSGYKEGAALVRRADGQIVQLGPLMYALLESVDGTRTNADLASLLSERLGRGCDEEHVARLAQKLAAQGLLAGSEHKAPPRRNPLLALRWKFLITSETATRRLTAPFTFFFRPWIMWPVVAAFVAVCWFVLIHKGIASATANAFQQPGLLLLVFALTLASAAFHEIGHAAACRYGGATPGGMGAGLYLVWHAFYTDVTDAYRLPKRDRLRVDLGGIYFNAVVAVVTLGVWFAWRADALLLLIGLQLLMMVKNLSPVIRSDGYHILADATGVPDLYAHIGPTLRRLLFWRRPEPSALTGRARLLVTAWVLIVVPVLLSLMLAAVVLLPRLLTTAWESGRAIGSAIPHEGALGVLASLLRLAALTLPVLGSLFITQKLVWMLVAKGRNWSAGRPLLRTVLVAAGLAATAGIAWALWPSGQYQPVRANQNGTLIGFGRLLSSPGRVAHPSAAPATVRLSPGTHLAVAAIPVGGPTKAHPALYVIPAENGDPAVALLDPGDSGGTDTAQATAFPFTLPSSGSTTTPSQPAPPATATSGGATYRIAYSLVKVEGGAQVTPRNSASAIVTCNACTTVAVSFQLVLVVGQSNVIAPINSAVAVNKNCPACLTTAIADQIVVTLKSEPQAELVTKLEDA